MPGCWVPGQCGAKVPGHRCDTALGCLCIMELRKKSSELLGCQDNGSQGVGNQGTMAPGPWCARLLGCQDNSLPELWLG